MKMTLGITLTIMLCAASTALADDTRPKDAKKTKTTAVENTKATRSPSAERKDGILVTGSYTKQKVHKSGLITDGGSQVIVVDSDTMERSGATSVRQLLTRQGVH